MQAKKRYLLLISCCAFLSIGYIGFFHWNNTIKDYDLKTSLKQYMHSNDIIENDYILSNPLDRIRSHSSVHSSNCRMETCFDFSRCDKHFKVYVYPIESSVTISSSYQKIIRTIESSVYYTSDPSQACIFVLSLDTLDRDNLSKDYIRNMPSRVQRLPLWNDGQNHIIYTLYTGTFPDYSEELGFDVGKAMLVKASTSIENFRVDFDISLPLFHKSHPEKGGESGFLESNKFPDRKPYLLAFKGKRYLYGIGSETRNSLYHLHNEKDIILVTTCRHGDNWKGHKDNRCDHDNELYDSYDYEVLLRNSSFCLVPRGRRLGSFRFLEALQAGCVPIILANKWELPFSEVIDWNKAVIWGDERLLLQIPDVVRSISASQQLQMRQQTQILWNQYFSSVEKIILSSLEIVRERLFRSNRHSLSVWNSMPGVLNVHSSFSDHLPHFPFFYDTSQTQPNRQYTAIIYISKGWSGPLVSSAMYKLIKNIARSKYAKKIIIVWNSLRHPAPSESRLPGGMIPVSIVPGNQSLMSRYGQYMDVETDAIFSLDEDASLSVEEFDFAFSVWLTFPDRIVGYSARSHFYSYSKDRWSYTSRWDNSYSMVLTDAAVYHRYYQFVMTNAPSQLVSLIDKKHLCDDILLNFFVSDLTKRPPIKLSQRKRYKDPVGRLKVDKTMLEQKSSCLNDFARNFNKLPLLKSSTRLDPVLFKDKVSIQRKKYRQIEKSLS